MKMKDDPPSRFYEHRSLAKKSRLQSASWEMVMALKAAAIIMVVIAAILIFHS